MIKSTVIERYYKLLSAYVANQEEKYLLLAEELGRKLMKDNIPPEDIVEIHENAIKRLVEEYPETTVLEAVKLASAPLMEMLMAYGLACRARSERLEREITEHSKSEEMLKESENRFRILAESTAMGILVYSGSEIIYVNKACQQLTGYSEDELLGMHFWSVIHPDYKESIRKQGQARLRGEQVPNRSEFKIIRKDGAERWIDFTAGHISWRKKSAAIGTAFDITERKLAEEESRKAQEVLQESEERFRSLYENSTIGLYRTTPDGKILLANPTLVKMLGYHSFEELSARNLESDRFEPEYSRKKFVESVESDGQISGVESAWKKQDGNLIYIRESARVIRDKKGVVQYYEGTVEDITERKKAEEEKERSQSLLKAALESTADGILAVDRDGRWTSFNQKFIDMWGIPKSIAKSRDGKTALEFVTDILEEPDEFITKVQELYANPEKDSFDSLKIKDGRIFECLSHPQRLNNEIVGRVWSFRNVTKNKILEEKIVSERNKFNTILEDLPVGVAVLDADDKYIYINPISMEIDGYKEDPEALIGKDVRSNHSKHIQTIIEKLLKDFKSGKMSHFSREAQRGKRSVEITYHAIRNAAGEYQGLTRLISDITAHKKEEEALRESEKRYRSLFEEAPDMIHVVDAKGRIVDANLIEMKMMGYSREEYIGKPLFEIVHPDYQNLTKTKFEKILRGERFKYETVLVTKKGTNIDVEVYVAAHSEEGKVVSTRAIIRDITERKLAEEASKQKQHLNELLLDSLPYAAMIIHKNRTILATNRAAREIGVNLGGICWRDYGNSVSIPEKDKRYIEKYKKPPASGARCVFCKAEKALEAMETVRLDVEIENKVWDTYWIPIDRETFLHFAVDITETKNYEASLRENRDWLNKSQKIGQLGSWDQKLDDNTLKWSDETYRIFGLEQQESEMTFKGFLKFVHPEDRDFVKEQTQKAQTSKNLKYQIEYRIIRTDGLERFIYERAEIITDDKGIPIRLVGILQDITERKRAEEKIQKSLKEKEVLLKEIHHRVKNNLQVITSLLNLQSGSISGKRNREAFNDSRDRIRSIALVHEVLYQSEDYSRVDFREYLKKLINQLFRSFLGDYTSVKMDLKVASIKLTMDKAVPCGIVVNELVTNALKHAFPKGQKGKITISLKKKNRNLELIVQDNGVGISDQREEEASGSLGMNLISILTEDQLNGTLKIEQNGGTIAKIQFPI